MSDTADQLLDVRELTYVLNVQAGVIARRQLTAVRARDHDIRRMVRRRELTLVHPAVYVNHTGPLTDRQRAWAAVLACWPAALTRESALPGQLGKPPLHVAVDIRRTLKPPTGVVVHRTADFENRVLWVRSPPRIAVEHAVIDVAASKPDALDAFRVISDACQSRETNAARIATTLASRPRVRRKRLLLELLGDLNAGACSVLEREWLRLESLHRLPAADRQDPAMVNGRGAYRDASYGRFGLVVELDGKKFHDDAESWDADHDRDLDTAVDRQAVTVRLTYGLVFRHGCRTIRRVAILLQRGGWTGEPVPCADCH